MNNKLSRVAKVRNKLGLHIRPAARIVELLKDFESKVTLTYMGETVNARSTMNIMILTAPKNAKVTIEVEGVDAKETLSQLLRLFKTGFSEGKR